MSEENFMEKLAEILQTDRPQLNDGFKLNSDNWDSLAIMATIAAIDEEFDVIVPGNQLSQCGSVGDLLGVIRANLNGP